jgi:hypothetical protein
VAADAARRAADRIVDIYPPDSAGFGPRSSAGAMKTAASDHGTMRVIPMRPMCRLGHPRRRLLGRRSDMRISRPFRPGWGPARSLSACPVPGQRQPQLSCGRGGLADRTVRTRRLRASGTGDNRSWAACLRIPRRIDHESGWRCLVAGSGRSSLFQAPAVSPSCWRMAPGWRACGPPAGAAGGAWVRAGPAGARSA